MKLIKFFEFVQKDFEPIKSFYIKDELNKKIWDYYKLNPEIRRDLLKIGQDFFDGVEIGTDVLDIVFCGSLCNYNWSENYSDFDLHIIINHSDVDENKELVEKFCDYAKKLWNQTHEIKLRGYDVEVAIQDESDLKSSIKSGKMGGVFSLLKDEWIKRPEKVDFVPDEKLIRSKAETIMSKVDDIEKQLNEDKFEAIEDKLSKVWKKIKNFRQSGLDSEGGELSIGNLVFKLLRRNGYVGKVMKMKKDAYDKQFENKKTL
jgi:hypothetical protein